MNYWLLSFGIGLAALSAAAWWWQRYPATKRGMKQFAQNPKARHDMSAWFAHRDKLLADAPNMSDAQVAATVEKLFTSDAAVRRTFGQVLEKVGARAEAPLMRAFNDPRCDRSDVGNGHFERSVFEIVTDLLAELGCAALVPRLSDRLNSDNEDERKHAAACIAKVGNDAAIEPTLAALRDPEEYVRLAAMRGARSAAKAERATTAFRDATFEALQRFVTGETAFGTYQDGDAAEILSVIDRDRAIPLLLSDRCIRLDSPQLRNILEQLNEVGATLSSDRVIAILDHAKAMCKHPAENIWNECLRMLVRADPALAAKELDIAMTTGSDDFKERAADALLELHDLPDPLMLNVGDKIEALPRPLAHVIVAWRCKNEVDNGGISQYFFNPGGDHWPLTLEAFQIMGAGNWEGYLRHSLTMFGSRGPSIDHSVRIKQYAKLSDKQEDVMRDWKALDNTEPPLPVLIARYMLKHADVFRAAAKTYPRYNTTY